MSPGVMIARALAAAAIEIKYKDIFICFNPAR
jgi:hypothetical protein